MIYRPMIANLSMRFEKHEQKPHVQVKSLEGMKN